jgi:hypothetical protein
MSSWRSACLVKYTANFTLPLTLYSLDTDVIKIEREKGREGGDPK